MHSYKNILLIRIGSSIVKEAEHPRHCCPPFTLKYIQALLAAANGYRVKLIDCLTEPLSLDEAISSSMAWQPDLIVISNDSLSYGLSLKYVQSLKKARDIFIVGIGQYAMAGPRSYLCPEAPFDAVLYGEAEEEALSLINRLNKREEIEKVKEYYFWKSKNNEPILVENLDNLPFPLYEPDEIERYRLLYPARINTKARWGHILSARGCFHRCLFCSPITRYTYGEKVRLRGSDNVVDEMEYLIGLGANIISFDDDDFTISEGHVRSVCREIKRRNLEIPWIAHARIDEVGYSLMAAMKEAGCVLLRIGVESGAERIVKTLNKNEMNIDWVKRSKEVFSSAREIGISTDALFIIGNPTETKDEILASIRLAAALNPDMIQIHFFTPYPGSRAYQVFRQDIDRENKAAILSEMYHYASPQLNLSNIDLGRLTGMRALFYRRILLRPAFLIRHFFKYLPFYLHNISVLRSLMRIRKILFSDYIDDFRKPFYKFKDILQNRKRNHLRLKASHADESPAD